MAEPVFVSNDQRTFEVYPEIEMRKVRFDNRYGIELAADLYLPEGFDEGKRYPAIVASHPHGGVKEQGNGLYAQEMATKGYVALAIDLSYGGDSGGAHRHLSTPEGFVEDLHASVDYLGTRPFVDRERIGMIGICASGGFAVAAASLDPRVKALVTVSMYDMGKAYRSGIAGSVTLEARKAMLQDLAEARWRQRETGETAYMNTFPVSVEETQFVYDMLDPVNREFFTYYCTSRGRTAANVGSIRNDSLPALMNFFPFENLDLMAGRPVMFVMGSEAFSQEFTLDAYEKAAEPKELVEVPGANHVALYDDKSLIPFEKIADFFGDALK